MKCIGHVRVAQMGWISRQRALWVLLVALGSAPVAVAQSSTAASVGPPGILPDAPINAQVDGSAVSVDPLLTGVLAGQSVEVLATSFTGPLDGPSLPPPSQPGDIVGFAVANAGKSGTQQRYTTFGQVFAQGAVQTGDALIARPATGGTVIPVQMDPLAMWPDGSVKFAALSMAVPALAGGAQQAYELSKAQTAGQAAPLSWSAIPFSLAVDLKLTAPAALQRTIDLRSALLQSLASKPDVWLSGPLALQARVDVPVNQTLHVTADITAYKDGTITADIQFNNDLTQVSGSPPGPVLPPLAYEATITIDGKSFTYHVPEQYQYQDWHTVVSSDGSAYLNIEHDAAYIEHTGAVLPFDLSYGVSPATLNEFSTIMTSAGFGTPLAANGVDPNMPEVGGRPDIGYTTLANASWLVTQGAVPESVALMQADAGGAVPWNMRLANGHWLTPGDYPNIWTDGRSGMWGLLGLANNTPIGTDKYSGWYPDVSHQPDMPYIPYLMTASRWYLDRLNAQAAFSLNSLWPTVRNIDGYTDIVTDTQGDAQQVRGAAWSMREIIEAAWIGKTGSWDQQYFSQVEADNWAWMQAQEKILNAAGQIAGFWYPILDTYYECGPSSPGCSPYLPSPNPPAWLAAAPWQEDFLTGIVIMGAEMGNTQAMQIAEWQRNWVVGRFLGTGMNPHDGCAYNIVVGGYPQAPGASPTYFTTWTQVESAMTASGISNGAGWAHSNGYYCQLARSVLGGLLTLNPSDTQVKSALSWLDSSGAPYIDEQSLQLTPNFDVVPLQ